MKLSSSREPESNLHTITTPDGPKRISADALAYWVCLRQIRFWVKRGVAPEGILELIHKDASR